ncbi:MAG: hypothetical protein GPOALKHO_001087 [Sodalis sp.]|nr:MAG: hypothetical protein GPOALKHO_001087 [Sodalis sp.]
MTTNTFLLSVYQNLLQVTPGYILAGRCILAHQMRTKNAPRHFANRPQLRTL